MIKLCIRTHISCLEKYSHLTATKLNFVWHGDTSHNIKKNCKILSNALLIGKNVVKISLKLLTVWCQTNLQQLVGWVGER